MLLAGLCALMVGLMATPAVLARLSSDGTLSAQFLERVHALRIFMLSLGGVAVLAGALRLRGAVTAALLAATGLLCAGAFGILLLVQRYPDNLLGRPDRLWSVALGKEMLLSDYRPGTFLVTPKHEVLRAKYPAINIHAHFSRWILQRTPEQLARIMDDCNLQAIVNLDPRPGPELQEALARYTQAYPDRFIMFTVFPFYKKLTDWPAFASQVDHLAEAKALGAKGVKIWKNLGMVTRDGQGRLVPIDDPRLDPLWRKLGELHMPVLIHVGDPIANYTRADRYNEQYEWLQSAPDWSYAGQDVPSLDSLLAQFEHAVANHPETIFILAHLGNRADDLRIPSRLLDRHPNLYMDFSAKVQELGRQPRAARAFFLRYQDQLLFATDGNPDQRDYRAHFRSLETADEYFDYPFWGLFNFGRWKIYGIDLPDEVLRKLYHDNAARLLGLPKLTQRESRE